MREALTIKTVSMLSGVTTHTLRAWERRYKAIVPKRTPTGRRIYVLGDVERVKLMARLTMQGYAISGIARLPKDQLEALTVQLPTEKKAQETPSSVQPSNFMIMASRGAILSALRSFDLDRINRELSRASISYDTKTLILEVFAPLLEEVGGLVDRGKLGVAEEHALSAIVRDQLGQILQSARQIPNASSFHMVMATPEGNLHEFGILLSTILGLSCGIAVTYLGPNMPYDEIARIARLTSASVVVIGSTALPRGTTKSSLLSFLNKLTESLPRSTELWVGGHCDVALGELASHRKVRYLKTLNEFDALVTQFASTQRSL